MKHMVLAASLGLIVLCMAGCPPTVFDVIFPTNSQDFSINDNNQLRMVVRFSEDVAMDTLIAGTNVILDTEDVSNANITISPGVTANEIVITSDDSIDNLLTFDPDGFFTLTLFGTGGNPVESVVGSILDGDFVQQYTLLG